VGRKKSNREQTEETKQSRWGFRGMTVRNWLELLIVPLVLVAIGFLFTMQQEARQQELEKQRVERERELEEQRAQDVALQGYLDQMGTLLLDDLSNPRVRTIVRARTLTVLRRLDPSRKQEVMQFLLEAELIQRVEGRGPIINLGGANLREVALIDADLTGAKLEEANLHGAELPQSFLADASLVNADLSDTNLRGADLERTDLTYADLSGANLFRAFLVSATLSEADLRSANLRSADLRSANLEGADLGPLRLAPYSGADLEYADLRKANLSDTDLSDTNLGGADLAEADGITNEELDQQARSLEGATMPNGQKYEVWLKNKNREEGEENHGST
jgi:uncharacterized protein YjbI with pentapeptide repeats